MSDAGGFPISGLSGGVSGRMVGMFEKTLLEKYFGIIFGSVVVMISYVMKTQEEIFSVQIEDYPRLDAIWEAGARNSHGFLAEEHFQYLRAQDFEPYFQSLDLACVRDSQGIVVAFIGVEAGRVEALFVDPLWHQVGIGRRLLEHAIRNMDAKTIYTNEQNERALAFYLRMGAKITGRVEYDPYGWPYPILHLKLPQLL